ncbi:MAG TPA: hypothetical protein ENK77_04945, partial [Epsilonproteobacteria bacterium]|nr:hypothetical protein [Campylobacterota bacterium]
MDTMIIGLTALFFSLVDVRLLGILASNFLFILLVFVAVFYSRLRVDTEFLQFNLPFLFLLGFGLAAYAAVLPLYGSEDLYYIFFKNKDLLSEILLALVIYLFAVKREMGTEVIRLFIEFYFLVNFIYLLFRTLNPDLAFFFHQGENNIPILLHGRERLLGWEPSYTVPVSIMFAAIYATIWERKAYLYLILGFTLYIIIAGGSKTAFIFLFVSLFIWLYFVFADRIKSKLFFFSLVTIVFMISAYFVLNYLNAKNNYLNYRNLDEYHQYKIISFITRKELITATLEEIAGNPLGYGFGNATVQLANSVTENIDNYISPEIKESEKYAKSSKSQFLDYTLSGGIIFLFLLYRQQVFLLGRINEMLDEERGKLYKIAIAFLIGTIVVGERIPFILILNFIWIVTIFPPASEDEEEQNML